MIPGLLEMLPGRECCRSGWIAAGLAALVLAGCGLCIVTLKVQRDSARAELAKVRLISEGMRLAQEVRLDAAIQAVSARDAATKATLESLQADLPKTDAEALAWALKHRRDQ